MNEHLELVLDGTALVAVSGLPGLLVARRGRSGQAIATLACVFGCAMGLIGTLGSLARGEVTSFNSSVYWTAPLGSFHVGLDALTCVFLLPVFLISMVGSLYGLGYWRQTERPDTAGRLQCFYGLLTAALALLVMSRDGVLFLVAWEVMAVAEFLLVITDDEDGQVRAAGWLCLAASHLATLALFGMFALLRQINGSFTIDAIALGKASPGQMHAIFFLALLGFGLKAGIMPLHIWLPPAHAAAPSHVSAMMSGVLIKMGVYGLVRVTGLLPETPLAWGYTLVALGAVSGIMATALAIAQLDLKRALAYSSVANIGIIFIGLGLTLCGRAERQPAWIILGLGGALLHVWNHALFKSLLFFCAGSVIHATGTRSLNLLGGLAKPMRWTGLAFLTGALGACALPPLNGFVSELLIYLGLFQALVTQGREHLSILAFSAPALALIGALSLAMFVQLYGVVFLGAGRSQATSHAHESPGSMLVPLTALVALMFLIGVAPTISLSGRQGALQPGAKPEFDAYLPTPHSVIAVIQTAAESWGPRIEGAPPAPKLLDLAPLGWLGAGAVLLAALLLLCGAWRRHVLNRKPPGARGVWDYGYAAPTARMQSTPASFGQMLVHLLATVLRPKIDGPGVEGLLPRPGRFEITVIDPALHRVVDPVTQFVAWLFARVRQLQQGAIQIYLLYIFLTVLGLLIWS